MQARAPSKDKQRARFLFRHSPLPRAAGSPSARYRQPGFALHPASSELGEAAPLISGADTVNTWK